jgi:hypothetical protein
MSMATQHKKLNKDKEDSMTDVFTFDGFEDSMTDAFTFDGETPSTGVHTIDGKLYCGHYSGTKWFSAEIKPFRDQITELRLKYQKGGAANNKTSKQQKAKQRRQESKIMKAKRQVQERISEVHQTDKFTFDGDIPSTGCHTSDGKLFCGSYSNDRWFSKETEPYRSEITAIRESTRGQGGRNPRKRGGGGNRTSHAKRKLQELTKSNEKLQIQLSALQSRDIPDTGRVVSADESASTTTSLTGGSSTSASTLGAGTAFGGRNEMRGNN